MTNLSGANGKPTQVQRLPTIDGDVRRRMLVVRVSSRKIAPGRSSYSWTVVADAAMRVASSRVSKLGADRRPGSSSKLDIRKRLAAVIAHFEAGVVCSSIVHGGGKRRAIQSAARLMVRVTIVKRSKYLEVAASS